MQTPDTEQRLLETLVLRGMVKALRRAGQISEAQALAALEELDA